MLVLGYSINFLGNNEVKNPTEEQAEKAIADTKAIITNDDCQQIVSVSNGREGEIKKPCTGRMYISNGVKFCGKCHYVVGLVRKEKRNGEKPPP